MGRRKSVSESTSIKQDTDSLKTWLPEPGMERVVTDDDELDTVFEDFPQNEACIELFRVNAQGGRPLFLEQIAPITFSFAYVCETYGGGRYMAKGKYKDGSKVRMPFEIEGDPFPVKRRLPDLRPHTPVVPGILPAGERVMDTAREAGGNMETVVLALIQELRAGSGDAEMKMLEKMRLYKELFSSGPQKEAPLDVALNMFTKGVELAGLQGGGDGPNFWMLALKELREPLMKIVDTVQMAIASPSRVVNSALSGLPGAPVVSQPKPESAPVPGKPEDLNMLHAVKAVLPALVNGAAKNADPVVYVDFLLDQFPASAYPQLRTFLEAPDCLDKLAYLEPGIRFQQEWWISLRLSLIEALTEEREPHVNGRVQSESPLDPATSPTTAGAIPA